MSSPLSLPGSGTLAYPHSLPHSLGTVFVELDGNPALVPPVTFLALTPSPFPFLSLNAPYSETHFTWNPQNGQIY